MHICLADIANKEQRLVLGLMSGTSHDGVDAAIARISGTSETLTVKLVGYHERKYPSELREKISHAFEGPTSLICSLNFEIARFFAETGLEALEKFGVSPDALDLAGSHGQTVFHIPPGPGCTGSTLQIGEGAVIAGMLKVPVVTGFRAADMAEGGQGAPLTPYGDWVLLRRPDATPIVVNIGGITNITAVTEELDRVAGFDSGPGNSLIDEAVAILSGGDSCFDTGGKWAECGVVITELLEYLLGEPYFLQEPPKSTGRERFGTGLVKSLLKEYAGARPEDILCTLTHLTSESIAKAIEDYILPVAHKPGPVALCGGGAKNGFLVRLIKERLPGLEVTDTGTLGVDPDAREALCFAILANEALFGTPASLPNVTGAASRRVLGSICI